MNWKNKYIDLIHSLPDYIVSIEDKSEVSIAKDKIQARCNGYSNVYVEIGSGSGHHLIERAKLEPEGLFIGFELRYKRTFRTAQKAEKDHLKNLIVIRGNAEFLPDLFNEDQIKGVYVNFPDPWDKRRWQKHRLLNQEFLVELSKFLRPDGFLAYKTDHQEYFHSTLKLIDSLKEFKLGEVTEDLYASQYLSHNVTTEFEQLFLSQNLPVFYLRCVQASSN